MQMTVAVGAVNGRRAVPSRLVTGTHQVATGAVRTVVPARAHGDVLGRDVDREARSIAREALEPPCSRSVGRARVPPPPRSWRGQTGETGSRTQVTENQSAASVDPGSVTEFVRMRRTAF